MIEVKRIFPECNADTLLIELILQRGKPAHYKGNSKVAKALEKIANTQGAVIGIVDSDKFKRNPPYLSKFDLTVVDKIESEGLLLKQISGKEQYLIFVCPRFENWIWKCAIECGVDPSQYNFFNILDLESSSKRNQLREDKELKRFVNAIVLKNPEPIQTFRSWLHKVI